MLQCFPSEIEKELIVFSDNSISRINHFVMFCFSGFTEDKGYALKLNMNLMSIRTVCIQTIPKLTMSDFKWLLYTTAKCF